MPIKFVTFDLDDTLWAIQSVIKNAEAYFYQWIEEHIPRITENFSVKEITERCHHFFETHPELHHDLSQLRKNWATHLCETHDYSLNKAEEGFVVFWKERNNVDLFPGAKEMLTNVSSNFGTGAITNGNADLDVIGKYFEFFLNFSTDWV